MEPQAEFLGAVKQGDTATVARLLEYHPELARFAGEYGKTGLHWAAETDQADAARLLLGAGADMEARTSWGDTPLAWAAVMGSGRVADLLLEHGASGLSLVVAAGLGKAGEVRAMTGPGADLSTQRGRGASELPDDQWPADSARLQGDVISNAMYAAARNGHTEVVRYLLDQGAAVDAKGFFGGTALHWAAINGHRDTVDLLLKHGASLVIRDAHFDATPMEWAQEGGHTEIAEALRPSGTAT